MGSNLFFLRWATKTPVTALSALIEWGGFRYLPVIFSLPLIEDWTFLWTSNMLLLFCPICRKIIRFNGLVKESLWQYDWLGILSLQSNFRLCDFFLLPLVLPALEESYKYLKKSLLFQMYLCGLLGLFVADWAIWFIIMVDKK